MRRQVFPYHPSPGPTRNGDGEMSKRILFGALTALSVGVGMLPLGAQAQMPEREERMRRLHFECDRGDRRACVEFGVLIGENRERHAEWRRAHPEWWWWERR